MSEETNLAEVKWNEWCDKNGITNKETLTRDQIERFQMSDEFGDILNSFTPDNQITYCIAVHAWNRLKKLYEDFKKEQAYYPYALALEPLLAKYEQWKASQPKVN
jgi:predicted AAA+ superfamily ATPase